MKIVKLFLGLSFGLIFVASFQLKGMHNTMTDQDFNKLFTFGHDSGLKNSPIVSSLNRRCVLGSITRGQQWLYPLEQALYAWSRRVKGGTYPEASVVQWITELLESGAPCKYADFNPLTCLLFLYDRGMVPQTLFQKLAAVLRAHGADPNDTTIDRYVVVIVARDPHLRTVPLSSLEALVEAKNAVSALDILNGIQASAVLTPDTIGSMKAVLSKPLHQPEPIATETNAVPYDHMGQPEEHKPCVFNMSHMCVAVAISFVCGIGVKCLYDWYYAPHSEDETVADQDTQQA